MNKRGRNITVWIVIFALVIGFIWFFNLDTEQPMKEVKESTMIGYLKSFEVESVRVEDTKITAELKSGEKVYTFVNSAVDLSFIYEDYIMPQVKDGNLKLSSPAPKKESIFLSLLPTIIMVGLMVFLFWFIMQQQVQRVIQCLFLAAVICVSVQMHRQTGDGLGKNAHAAVDRRHLHGRPFRHNLACGGAAHEKRVSAACRSVGGLVPCLENACEQTHFFLPPIDSTGSCLYNLRTGSCLYSFFARCAYGL